MDANEFGTYLRRLRKAKGMTLMDVVHITGLSQGYLSNIERGDRGTPAPELIRKISEALRVTHIGMMIAAGYITEEEVLTFRHKAGINDLKRE